LRRLIKILELSRRLTADERLQLKDWIFDVIVRKAGHTIDKDVIVRIGQAFEREEEPDMMTYAIERAIDEIAQRGERKGKREGKQEVKQEGIREGKQEGIREGKQEGIREGKQAGIREGKQAGIREGKFETAMAMLADGLPLEAASKYSGIPADELKKGVEDRKPGL
jgi:flagellar biosynthesis/type III secretory pathway protein FliH